MLVHSALLLLALPPAPHLARAQAPDSVTITEWRVPWEGSRPRDPFLDRQGRVWFVGQAGNYIAYLEPRSGQFKRYEIDAGVHPHNLIVADDGMVWYAGNMAAHIGRLDPATGKITKYPMPDQAAKDPHTLTFDRAGDIWFTVQRGNFVGKLETKTGRVRLIAVPTARALPYGIAIDSKGRPWIDLFGTNKLAMVDPVAMTLREYPLPDARTRPRRIAITSDDAVWYDDYQLGAIGRLDPATGRVEEWKAPLGLKSLPYAMAVDDRDRLWFVETGAQPNRLVGFDPRTHRFFSVTEIRESGAGTVRHMIFHAPTRELWFGTDAGTIGRARVP